MAPRDNDSADIDTTPGHDPNNTPANTSTQMREVKGITTDTGGIAISRDYFKGDPGANPAIKGRKPEGYPNEDRWSATNAIIPADENPTDLLHKVMSHVAQRHRNREDGATVAATAIVDEKVYASNLGDAVVIAFIYNPANDEVRAIKITRTHTVNNPSERDKMPDQSRLINTSKGYYYCDKNQKKQINLSRSIGDRDYDLIRIPESRSLDLKPYLDKNMNVYVACGSDGIMEGTTLENMRKLVKETIKTAKISTGQMPSLDEIAIHLTAYRHKNDRNEEYPRDDDSTVVVQQVKREPESSQQPGEKNVKLITIVDGHGYKSDISRTVADSIVEEIPHFFKQPQLMRDTEKADFSAATTEFLQQIIQADMGGKPRAMLTTTERAEALKHLKEKDIKSRR